MKFEELAAIDVSAHVEKKNGLSYLSWSWAWSEFKKACADATYEIKHWDGKPYMHDTGVGFLVETKVTANGETHEMWLPVMDYRNKAIQEANMMDINKTIMRCLVKNLAMFGLGMNLYAGEDLPQQVNENHEEYGIAKAALLKRINEQENPKECKEWVEKAWKKPIDEMSTAEVNSVLAYINKAQKK